MITGQTVNLQLSEGQSDHQALTPCFMRVFVGLFAKHKSSKHT